MNYNAIKFNNEYFVNYYGLRNLELQSNWEEIYNNLVLDNSLSNVTKGYVFINTITHFLQDWFKVNSLGLPNTTFWRHLISRILYGPRYANTWIKFCGFFQIKFFYDEYHNRNIYQLCSSDFSYAESIKLINDERFRLFENQVICSADGFCHFPRSIIPVTGATNKLIPQYLFFPLSEFIELNNNFEATSVKADANFFEGKLIDTSEQTQNNNEVEKTNDESGEDLKDSESVMISALFFALEQENAEKFTGNDKLVVNHLQKLFPNQPYLTMSTFSKRLGKGRRILGISKK